MAVSFQVNDFFDPVTGTYTYLVVDLPSKDCVVIDPVLDFDMISGSASTTSLKPVIEMIDSNNYRLCTVLETHAHADHLTAAKQLREMYGASIAIGAGITDIQENFKQIYGFADDFNTDGRAFDRLLNDGDTVSFGCQTIHVIATPGHTADSLSFRIGQYIFIGDTLFHPDIGSARCDFPGGDARELFRTIAKILSHDDQTILCLCHDYPGDSREPETFITVARMKQNIHPVQSDTNVEKFVGLREGRDKDLALPKLIIPSVQVNCQAGLDLNAQGQTLTWPVNQFK